MTDDLTRRKLKNELASVTAQRDLLEAKLRDLEGTFGVQPGQARLVVVVQLPEGTRQSGHVDLTAPPGLSPTQMGEILQQTVTATANAYEQAVFIALSTAKAKPALEIVKAEPTAEPQHEEEVASHG